MDFPMYSTKQYEAGEYLPLKQGYRLVASKLVGRKYVSNLSPSRHLFGNIESKITQLFYQ